jgi:hypothetical protein
MRVSRWNEPVGIPSKPLFSATGQHFLPRSEEKIVQPSRNTMTHIKLESPRADSGMTDDLFKLIDESPANGEYKKGLFATFKKTAVKLSRRSVGKEFDHQALAGPSFSNDSEQSQSERFSGDDDVWGFETRDDWGGCEETRNESASCGRDDIESKDQNGIPPLAPSKTKFRSPVIKRRFNPKLQFSGTKKKADNRKPKDFSLTQMISQSFDSENGSISAKTRKYLGDEPDSFEVYDQSSFPTLPQSTEYAQLDVSGGPPVVILNDVETGEYHPRPDSNGEESGQSESTINTCFSEEVVMPSSQTVEMAPSENSSNDSLSPPVEDGIMSFKDRLAFYKNRSSNVTSSTETKTRISIQGASSKEHCLASQPVPVPVNESRAEGLRDTAVCKNAAKKDTPERSIATDESKKSESSGSPQEKVNPFQVKLRPIRISTDASNSVDDRTKDWRTKPTTEPSNGPSGVSIVKRPVKNSTDASNSFHHTVTDLRTKHTTKPSDGPVGTSTAKRLSIGGKALTYVPMMSCPGDIKLLSSPQATVQGNRISSSRHQSPQPSVAMGEVPSQKKAIWKSDSKDGKPTRSIAQHKPVLLSSISFDSHDTLANRESLGEQSTGTRLQNRQSSSMNSRSTPQTADGGRESIFGPRIALTASDLPKLRGAQQNNGKTKTSAVESEKKGSHVYPKLSTNVNRRSIAVALDSNVRSAPNSPCDSGTPSSPSRMSIADRKKALIGQYHGSRRMDQNELSTDGAISESDSQSKLRPSWIKEAIRDSGANTPTNSRRTFAKSPALDKEGTGFKGNRFVSNPEKKMIVPSNDTIEKVPADATRSLSGGNSTTKDSGANSSYVQMRATFQSATRVPAAHCETKLMKPLSSAKQSMSQSAPPLDLNEKDEANGDTAFLKFAVKTGAEERSDFAARRSFFNSKSTAAADFEGKLTGEGQFSAVTRITALQRVGGLSTSDGHPLYVTVDSKGSPDECLSPNSMEHQIVCKPIVDEPYFDKLQEQDSLASPIVEAEPFCPESATEKYHAVKARFSQKALPWRQKNAADRYLERKKHVGSQGTGCLPSPNSESTSSTNNSPRQNEVFCPF